MGWCAALLWMIPAFAFGAPIMVEKNLFSQDRKPPSPESAKPPPQANKPGVSVKSIQLDGVIVFGEDRKALLRVKGPTATGGKGKQASPYVVVREGGRVGDYKVVKIETKSVHLEKDGQTETIALFAEGKVSPPIPQSPPGMNAPPPEGPQAPAEGAKGRPPGAMRQQGGPPDMAGNVNLPDGPASAEEAFMQTEEPFEEDAPADEGD